MKINTILAVEDNAFNGLSKVTVLADEHANNPVYLFCKPENKPTEGDTRAGTVAPDKAGKLKFTPEKNPQFQQGGGSTYQAQQNNEKTFKVDPDKTASIEKQTTLQRATDLVVAVINNSANPIHVKTATEAVEAVYTALWAHVYTDKPADTTPTPEELDNLELVFENPSDATEVARKLAQGEKSAEA